MEYKDYYAILGVGKKASDEDIKHAYRRLARKYHPDVSKEPNAEEQFKNAKEAYEVLKDSEKRAAYDRLGDSWQAGQTFRPPPGWQEQAFNQGGQGNQFHSTENSSGDFSDFFSSLFGGGAVHFSDGGGRQRQAHHHAKRRGRDLTVTINVTLREAFQGAQKTLQLQRDQTTQTVKVNIPAGLLQDQQLRLVGQGEQGVGGGPAGDLYMKANIEPDPLFSLQGKDVFLTLPITPWEAALGAQIEIPTLAGKVGLTLKPGTKSGQKLRLKGRGLPGKPSSGDQYALIEIQTPPAHTDEEKQLYEKMSHVMKFNPRKAMT